MKILIFTDTFYDSNGVSRFYQDLVTTRKDVYIITSNAKKNLPRFKRVYNYRPFFKMKMPFYAHLDLVNPSFMKIKKRVKKIKPDLIHIATPGFVGINGFIVAHLYKIRIAGIYHTDFPEYIYNNTQSKFLRNSSAFLLSLFYKKFDQVFVRTNEYKENVKKDLRLDDEKVEVFTPGIDTRRFDTKFRDQGIWKKFSVRKESIKVLYVGRRTVEKNFHYLLEVWETFIRRYDIDADLIVVGEGNVETLLKNVYYLGYQKEDLPAIYASCDIFLFPSVTDTLGQVVIEAMSSKLAVIVSNKGGPKEIVENVILPIETKIWVNTLYKLCVDKGYRKQLQKRNYELSKQLSFSKSAEDFIEKNRKTLKSSLS